MAFPSAEQCTGTRLPTPSCHRSACDESARSTYSTSRPTRAPRFAVSPDRVASPSSTSRISGPAPTGATCFRPSRYAPVSGS